jgi:hypothetical protein
MIEQLSTIFVSRTKSDERYSHEQRQSSIASAHLDCAHDLMQGNYYDRTRFDLNNLSTSTCGSERGLIDINVEDYKKVRRQRLSYCHGQPRHRIQLFH